MVTAVRWEPQHADSRIAQLREDEAVPPPSLLPKLQGGLRMLVFVHIPRTAGTSIRIYAERHLSKEQILPIYGQEIEHPTSALGRVNLSEIKLIRGHFSTAIKSALPLNAKFFTIVREPVERVYSLYKYIRRDGKHPLHDEVMEMDLIEFVTSEVTTETDNGQVRQLSGCAGEFPQSEGQPPTISYGKCMPEMLDLAVANLKQFAHVGMTHEAGKTAKWLCEQFGWPHTPLGRSNSTKRDGQLTLGACQVISQRNALDAELFDRVVRGRL